MAVNILFFIEYKIMMDYVDLFQKFYQLNIAL